jgi:hypothetical protein
MIKNLFRLNRANSNSICRAAFAALQPPGATPGAV